ncbi:MAG: hypothetical protein EPN97_15825 [Alphaproteobacteria bacterium]|nr:MAG: hypothetical protein EPN97_15825 [Alphaproteobacteria bacterium]
MRAVLCALILSLFFITPAHAFSASDLDAANKYYAEKSYQLAATEFAKYLSDTSDAALSREVIFKWSDSVTRGKDEANREKAEKSLRDLIEGKDHDRWWAEANVSLAAHFGEKDPWGKGAEIKKWLDDARDWWAGSDDVDLAREKFIAISFQLADFNTSHWGWYVSDVRPIRLGDKAVIPQPQGNQGLQILFEEILKIAKSDADKAHAHYGLGMSYMQNYSGDQKLRDKAIEEFEEVTDDFEDTEWADDAWYQMAMFYENKGDYVKAEDTYKDLLKHFKEGSSQWVDDSKRRLEQIVNPQLSVSLGNTFIPESEIQFSIGWRNIKQAEVTLYKLDLPAELRLESDTSGYSGYQELLRIMVEKGRHAQLEKQVSWTAKLEDDGKHVPHSEYKGMAEWRKEDKDDKTDPKLGSLPAGAYMLMVASGEQKAWELVLVSDLALVNKTSKNMALFFAMNAKTGKPVAEAKVGYIYSYYDANGNTRWERGQGTTDSNGLLKAELHDNAPRNYSQQHSVFAAVSGDGGQAFVQNNYYQYNSNNKGEWWLYAFSDRPAYRPNETVSFKAILRHPENGAFANPAGMAVKARIYDAQGNQVKEGAYTLNAYGAFDDALVLDEKAVLGQYRMDVYTADLNNHLASTPLFSLEEYKLPEFVVTVKPEPKDDKAKVSAYRLGDTVQVSVDAQYYFGGPVANAQVEYLVYQTPYYHQYQPVHAYDWYYKDMYPQNYGYGGYGQLLKTEKITTDKEGKAKFKIETPKDSGNDLQYHVEVRVVDQSRREIRSTSDIKVTKNAFFAYLEPKQNLYRPGDKAVVTIKTMTANSEPVAVEGKVTILKNTWREPVMLNGRMANPAGYNGQEVVTKFVKTNDKGEATFEFEPGENGFYAVEFTGFDEGREVKGVTNVYVCDTSATNIGYRYSGLQIIAEKDTFNVGDTLRAMIVSDQPDTYVLFTTEADGIYDYQMIHLEGSVKLVEVPVKSNYTPNVFLSAMSGDHYQMKMNALQVIVPPVEKFLNVKITSDKEVYQPQEEGAFELTVTDKDGKPVTGEVALGLVDASVYYIHDEYAQDIRQFFYGDKRQQSIQTQTSFQQHPYVKLVRGENNELISDDERQRRDRAKNPMGQDEGSVNGREIDRLQGQMGAVGGKLKDGAYPEEKAARASSETSAPAAASPVFAAKEDGYRMNADKKTLNKVGEQEKGQGGGGPAQAEEPLQVRNDFRSTVIWQPAVKTDAAGKAVVKVKYPDSLTTWRMTARAVTPETAIGTVTHEVKSNKELMIRLQAPRFFTERDLVDVSALIDNMSDKPITVSPVIKVEGVTVTGLYRNGEFVKGEAGPIDIPAHGQGRMDWAVSAQKAGVASITVSVRNGKTGDAMQKTYPVIPHGIEKFIAQSAVLKGGEGEQTKEIAITIPKERIKESTSLRLNLSPSLAANLLDALPYLADYPYGCVEQTMSRFLPAVVVAKTMRDLGISSSEVEAYISDVLEPRGDPKGHPQRRSDPTYSRLKTMTTDALKRLYDFQHADGGWGWWKTGDSDRFMTAYVVWGMSLARDAGTEIQNGVIYRGAEYLKNQLVEEENAPDMLAWMLHALSGSNTGTDDRVNRQRKRLWEMRDKLNPYARALFALAEKGYGDAEHSRILSQNIINGIDQDKGNGTAHWGESGIHYRWSEGGVEATAFNINALSQLDPQSAYLEPAVKWMSLNRRGASWKNTRDTAIAILGLTEYLKATHELSPDYTYKVMVNGVNVREGKVDSSNVFSFNRIVDVPAEHLRDGNNTVKIVMSGKGALYAAAYAKYFTLEEPITKAGNEIFVERKYFIQSVKETLMKGYTNDWKPLKDGDAVHSGDRIRVEVTLDAKNNYEYLVAEDYKPAGLEAVELNSGAGEAIDLDRDGRETSSRTPLYQEFRDQKAAFFIGKVKQGKHLFRYELRAEIPGKFHAMPNQSHAMYVPEIRANSDEMRIDVNDAADSGKK